MSEIKTVLIADDHAVSSSGLQQLLTAEPAFEVLPPVADGMEAVVLAKSAQPDLAILDYAMPRMTGLEAMREIRRWSPNTRVGILTGNLSPGLIASLLEAGVDGLWVKTTSPRILLDGLRRLAAGDRVIAPDLPATDDATALSPRELQVLACIADGLTNDATAGRLSISAKTVESHRTSLMRKLGVRSTASLIVQAMRQGLIDH
jgi:DNA-binding NarL/FixJ family response regulator